MYNEIPSIKSKSDSIPPEQPFFSPLCSIEEDFVTWKENLWSSVCQKFGIDGSEQGTIVREYELTVHTNLPPEKIYIGEPHRLGTFEHQKP